MNWRGSSRVRESDLAVDMLVSGTTEKAHISTVMDGEKWKMEKSVPHEETKERFWWFAHVWHFNLICSFSLPLIPLHLLCTQRLQNWQRMELLPRAYLQTVQGNLPSAVIFPAFAILITVFFFLTFIVNSCDSNTLSSF